MSYLFDIYRGNEVERLKILDIENALKGGNLGSGGNYIGGGGTNGASGGSSSAGGGAAGGGGGGGGGEPGRLGTPAFINLPETNSLKPEEIEVVNKEITTLNAEQVGIMSRNECHYLYSLTK